ncbi:unnamed protein product [Malus baccata var. baccata]
MTATADLDPSADHNAKPPGPVPNNPSVALAFLSHLLQWEISGFKEQREGTIFRFSSEAE